MKPAHRKAVDERIVLDGATLFRTRRKGFLDALDVLKNHGWTADGRSARVTVRSLRMPSGGVASFVMVQGNAPETLHVSLPVCSAIRASDTYGNTDLYDPGLFHEAVLDEHGNTSLANGMHLHKCQVIAMTLPIKWEHDRDVVVRQAISFLRAEEDCILGAAYDLETGWVGYLPLGSSADQPSIRLLARLVDYSALTKLEMETEKLEAFVAFHESHLLTERRYSRQTLAKILRDAGIRIPVTATD